MTVELAEDNSSWEFTRWHSRMVREHMSPHLTSLERDMVRSAMTRQRIMLTPGRGVGVRVSIDNARKEIERLEQIIHEELELYSQPRG